MKLKKICISFFIAVLLGINCIPLVSSAEPEDISDSDIVTTTQPLSEPNWEQLRDEYQEAVENEIKEQTENDKKNPDDYYEDPYYDTDGNASLIDSKEYKVIYSSTELLFTAVTTKDGHVFYIIINYGDDDGEDNVYFLNKVDDFDLYSLINSEKANNSSSSNSDTNIVDEYISQQTTSSLNNDMSQTSTTSSAIVESKKGSSKLKLILILLLVVAVGAGGWIIPKIINKPKKNKIEFEDDELEEISEDES